MDLQALARMTKQGIFEPSPWGLCQDKDNRTYSFLTGNCANQAQFFGAFYLFRQRSNFLTCYSDKIDYSKNPKYSRNRNVRAFGLKFWRKFVKLNHGIWESGSTY